MYWIVINFYIISTIIQLCTRSQKNATKGESANSSLASERNTSDRDASSSRRSKPDKDIRTGVLDSIKIMRRGYSPKKSSSINLSQRERKSDFSSSRQTFRATSEDSQKTLSINVPLGKAAKTPPDADILVQPEDRKEFEASKKVQTPRVGFSKKLEVQTN